MSEFGERLKKARENKNWNQAELARAMNLTQASISQFEKGQRLPTPNNIYKFAKVLGVSREFLAGEDEGNFEKSLLMRNLKNLSPESLKKINDYVELIKNQKNKLNDS